MAWFDNGESHIYYEESGAGVPVLLLAGWGGTIDEFAQVGAVLASRFRVIAADVPGSGKSGPSRVPTHRHTTGTMPRCSWQCLMR